ncbi:MAG: DUF2182 domain-containing protein [Rhizobiaceae bacterium]
MTTGDLGRKDLSPLEIRDRLALFISIGGLVAVSWLYLIAMSNDMGSKMQGMALGLKSWSLLDFTNQFLMWAVMMVAMMVPTAFRSILILSQIAAMQKRRGGHPYVSGLWFTAGYALAWTGFSIIATSLQWGLDQAALLSAHLVLVSPALGAGVVIVAGFWQLTPMKDTCLRHCQSPVLYLAARFKPGYWGAISLGLNHGLYCLGCCWVLMGLLFVGGVMNLAWILIITLFVLVEKLLPATGQFAKISGIGMILTGLGYLYFWT